mmetsp:Transcript_36581/g.40854  ORF Transcript_36581/g.40854 Transcript_36581/m.40854 type:complete len:84 (+) Transcript_36581:76-327(+)
MTLLAKKQIYWILVTCNTANRQFYKMVLFKYFKTRLSNVSFLQSSLLPINFRIRIVPSKELVKNPLSITPDDESSPTSIELLL